jgi:hypothetical protein
VCADRGVEGGGGDALVLGDQVVGVAVEVGDAADHRGADHEVVAAVEQLRDELGVLRVALDQAVARVRVVGLRDAAVLGEVVEADHVPAVLEQLLHEVAGDEAVRTGDQGFHSTLVPSGVAFQMSTTGFPPKSTVR